MKYAFLLLLLISLAGCSRKSPDQLMADARQAEERKDFPAAINSYSELVTAHQDSPQAEEAQYHIALIYNNEMHDVQKAIDAYRNLYVKFPNSTHAPSALFLTGFLYNNELHRVDSAKAIYETFVKLYPSNELASSAQFELNTLGQDADDVLHKDILAKQSADTGREIKTLPARIKAPKQ